jgi:hypothetical protein
MTLLSDIAAYMVTNSIGSTSNIFHAVSTFPDQPDLAMMLFDYRGGVSEHTHDGARIIHASVQIITRGTAGNTSGNASAKAKADAIDALFDGLANTTVGSTYILLMAAQSPPVTYGPDSKGRPLWEQNFSIMMR